MQAIIWYIAIQIIGFCTFQYLFNLMGKSRDRGYAVSKVLGIVFIAYITWVINVYFIASFTTSNLIIITLVFCFGGILCGIKNKNNLKDFLTNNKKYMFFTELIFLSNYIFFLSIAKHSDFSQWGGRNIDLSYVWAIFKCEYMPVQNPWLSNTLINDYYFGHYIIASLSKLLNITPDISYTLSLGILPALFITVGFAIIYEITGKIRYGIFGGLILGFVGSNFFILQLFNNFILMTSDIVSLTTQVIPGTTNEYPLSVFINGQLLSNSVAMPICLTLIYLIYKLFKDEVLRHWNMSNIRLIILIGFLFSIIYFTNTWDLPIYAIFFVLILLIDLSYQFYATKQERENKTLVPPFIEFICIFNSMIFIILTALCSFVFFIPFNKLTEINKVSLKLLTSSNTSIIHLVILFGLYFYVMIAFGGLSFFKTSKNPNKKEKHLFDLFVIFAALLIFAGLYFSNTLDVTKFILMLIILMIPSGLKKLMSGNDKRLWFSSALAFFGMALILGCEVFYVKTIVDLDPEIFRSQTILKLYIQVFIFLGLSIPFLVLMIENKLSDRKSSPLFLLLLGGFLLAHILFPIMGSVQKTDNFKRTPHLNCTNFVSILNPSTYKAISWINENIKDQKIILEGVGERYKRWGMISSFTGNPTVVQWTDVLYQSGNSATDIKRRSDDVDKIYRSEKFEDVIYTLRINWVDYIYVGEFEKKLYPKKSLEKFEKNCKLVYDSDGVEIYSFKERI